MWLPAQNEKAEIDKISLALSWYWRSQEKEVKFLSPIYDYLIVTFCRGAILCNQENEHAVRLCYRTKTVCYQLILETCPPSRSL
jgi:hypothetical protein